MAQRFSPQELYELRNEIPVDALIKETLDVPVKYSDGMFRFLCPACHEFQTATNPKTNLARCFRCERNFNTIDLVIAVRKTGFVESVNYLRQLLSHQRTHQPDRNRSLQKLLQAVGNSIA